MELRSYPSSLKASKESFRACARLPSTDTEARLWNPNVPATYHKILDDKELEERLADVRMTLNSFSQAETDEIGCTLASNGGGARTRRRPADIKVPALVIPPNRLPTVDPVLTPQQNCPDQREKSDSGWTKAYCPSPETLAFNNAHCWHR
jgi:hypothetical protein